MAGSTNATKKWKPPAFRHLPLERAKKLKRSWVEVQKIKSQWKTQKRKEGIVTKGKQLDELVDEQQDESDTGSVSEDTLKVEGATRNEMFESEETQHPTDDEGESGNDDNNPESDHSPKLHTAASSRSSQRKSDANARLKEDPPEKPSLRDLQRQAYSRSSLHTHKSDPRNRRRGSHPARGQDPTGRGRGRGGPAGGHSNRGGSLRGQSRGRGRGQPDMRLRMNAMLEKIRRDFA